METPQTKTLCHKATQAEDRVKEQDIVYFRNSSHSFRDSKGKGEKEKCKERY